MARSPYSRITQGAAQRQLGITLEGPFFTRDPGMTILENLEGLMLKAARLGEAEVKDRIHAAPRRTAGPSLSATYVLGRTTNRVGRRWMTAAVVSAWGGLNLWKTTKAQAIRVEAALAGRHQAMDSLGRNIGITKGHEGTAHVFRRTATSLRRATKTVDLTKGLN